MAKSKTAKEEIRVSLEPYLHQDPAFDELVDFFNDLCKKYGLNFYDAFGILACLKVELEKNLKRIDEEENN